MFEQASRLKLRFSSVRGELAVEQLWDVPLRSKDDFNLNKVAQAVNHQLESSQEENFVDVKKADSIVKLKFDLVKHIIDVKLDEEETLKQRAANRVEREKLLRILAEKQEGKLTDLSEKELQRRINALES